MLSRRHLRIRVMQALYSYYQSDNKDMLQTEQELLRGTNKIYELYCIRLLNGKQEKSLNTKYLHDNKRWTKLE